MDENQDAPPSSTANENQEDGPPPSFSTYTQVSFVQQFIGLPAATSTSHHQFIAPPTLPGSPPDLYQFIRNALQSGAGHPFGAAPPTPTLQIGASTPTPALATHTQGVVTAPPTHQHPPDLIFSNLLNHFPVMREYLRQLIDTRSVCFHRVAITFSLYSLKSEFTRFGGSSFIEVKWHGLTGGHVFASFPSVAVKDNVLLDPPNLGSDMVVHSASERLSCDLCKKARESGEF